MGSSYDGSIRINTKIDNSGIKAGLKEQENSVRSQAAKLAAEYRKQGMNASEAFKKAWGEVDRSSSKSCKEVEKNSKKAWKEVDKSSKKAAKNSSDYWRESATNSQHSIGNISCGFNSLMSSVRKLVGVVGIAFGLHELIQFGKQAIELASDIEEVQNVVDTAFGAMSYKIEEFADTAIEMYGISKLTAKQTGSTFMAMAKGMKLEEGYASDLAVSLTGLSADMASFFNVKQDVASTSLKSIFTGETETLKQFGVVMTETNLQEYAYQQGINKSISALSQKEKVMLRAQYVQEQLAMVSGDFAKTQDSWANQTRILSERWKELLSILGTGLITVLTPVVRSLNVLCANLINVANTIGKVMSEIFGIEAQSFGGSGAVSPVTDSYEDIADSASAAAGATDKYAKSTKEAKKANEGALASFDKINVLQRETASNNNNSNSNADPSGNFGEVGNVTTEVTKSAGMLEESAQKVDKLSSSFDNLRKICGNLGDIFKAGFFDSLGDVSGRFETIQEGFSQIKESLKDIFTDPKVLNSAAGYVESLIGALGSIVGAAASIAISIAANLVGGIGDYLSSNSERIKNFLIESFDIQSEILSMASEFVESFAYIFEAFASQNGIRLTSNLIGIFADAFMELHLLLHKLLREIYDIITRPFIDNKEEFREVLTAFLGTIADVLGTIKDFVDEVGDELNLFCDNHIKPFLDSIAEGVSSITGHLLGFWQEHLQPLLDDIAKRFDECVKGSIIPLVKKVLDCIGEIIDVLTILWKEYLVPIINWIIDNILPAVVPIISTIVQFLFGLVDVVSQVLGGFISVIKGAFTIIKGLITGDLDTIFEGIKTVLGGITDQVKGFANAIISVVEMMINFVVNGINNMITSLNTVKIDIPEWVPVIGGKNFNPNISEIKNVKLPRLAQGAVIPPNKKFAAILGDQTQGYNIEAPSALIKQMVVEGIKESGISSGPVEVVIQFAGDDAQLARHLNPILAAESARKGVNLVTTVG